MQRFFGGLVRAFTRISAGRARPGVRSTSLGLEALEGRSLPSTSPLFSAVSVHYPTDPCAQFYPTDPCVVTVAQPAMFTIHS